MKKWIFLILYIIGVISYSTFFMITKTQQRYLFLIIVIYLQFHLVELIKYIKETRKKETVIKYSQKQIVGKNLKKLS